MEIRIQVIIDNDECTRRDIARWERTSFGSETYLTAYQMVAQTQQPTFIDNAVAAGSQYMYYVVGVDSQQTASTASNLVTFTALLPAETFVQLLDEVATLVERGRIVLRNRNGSQPKLAIEAAQSAAAACHIPDAIEILLRQAESRAICLLI